MRRKGPRAMRASALATQTRLGGPGQWVLNLPPTYVAGVQVLYRSVVAGTEPIVTNDVVAAQEQVTGRSYLSLVPTQLHRRLGDPAAVAALAGFDAVLVGGGPLGRDTRRRAEEAGIAVVQTYGMSETTGGCVYDGLPLDGVRVRIDDDGRIMLGGATLAKGYRNPVQPDPFAEPSWFRTDDIGVIDDSGVLTVLGRVDDAISTGGLTVLPQLVEAALATHPAVAECAVFGIADERLGQRVVAAVVPAGAAAPTLTEIRAHVAQALDSTAAPRELHVLAELPRRGIGKVDRHRLIELFTH